MNTLRTFRWRHLLGKPETTYAYTWYIIISSRWRQKGESELLLNKTYPIYLENDDHKHIYIGVCVCVCESYATPEIHTTFIDKEFGGIL